MTTLENNFSKTVVDTVMGKPVTQGELSAAFDKVANKANWKNAINAVVDVNDFEMAMIAKAVTFFTGSVAKFKPRIGAPLPKCRYRVTAAGYYKTIGA
jgi:hypothetical protein